jgi:hypothetical protein
MKALSKLALISLVSSIIVLGTGCGQQGLPAGKSPEDVIKEALLNKNFQTENVFQMNMKANLQGEVDGELNELIGDMMISGTSNTEEETMQVTFSIDGKMNTDSLKANVEIRANEDGVFAKIDKIEISDEATSELINDVLEEKDLKGKWIKLSFMEPEEVTESGYADFDYDEGDPLPFSNIEFVGREHILGLESYHFVADFDEEMVSEMYGGTPEVEQFLDAATIKGDVYVAVNEMVITGFGGSMEMDDKELNGTVEFSFLMNPTTSNKVTTPSYETELTEEDIAELMFGSAMMMDPSMMDAGMEMEFDESMMMDMEEFDMESFEGMEGMPEDFDMAEFEAAMEELEAIQ